MTISDAFAIRIVVSCVDCVGIIGGLALAQRPVSLHPMIIIRQACRPAGFGDPGVDVTAPPWYWVYCTSLVFIDIAVLLFGLNGLKQRRNWGTPVTLPFRIGPKWLQLQCDGSAN